jgi:hypothetical protein
MTLNDLFHSIKPIRPYTEICSVEYGGTQISCWQTNEQGNWQKLDTFHNLERFINEKGNIQTDWEKVQLVNGDSLNSFPTQLSPKKYLDTAYIVEPTTLYHTVENIKKPTVFTNYYIKDKFKNLVDKLPELQDIF